MKDLCKDTDEYNPGNIQKILVLFDDVIAYMINNKKPNPIITELCIRVKKLNNFVAQITKSYSEVPQDITQN